MNYFIKVKFYENIIRSNKTIDLINHLKKNKYQNAENFKELFTRLVIKILNIDNFQSVIKDVATINDIYLLSAIFIEIKREAERESTAAVRVTAPKIALS